MSDKSSGDARGAEQCSTYLTASDSVAQGGESGTSNARRVLPNQVACRLRTVGVFRGGQGHDLGMITGERRQVQCCEMKSAARDLTWPFSACGYAACLETPGGLRALRYNPGRILLPRDP